ncbi:MAG: peptidase [Gammaproteobacteria bacterium]|nr:MAG: peptidase [Gammaproteobacteria bacterium]
MVQTKAYGSWSSPLSAKILAQKSIRYGHMCVDSGNVYWLESRASENGRGVIVKRSCSGKIEDLLPDSISVRSKVHEYGSGDYIVKDDVIYFANAKDQCVYRYDGKLQQLTEKVNGIKLELADSELLETSIIEARYADFVVSKDNQYLICVRETHFQSKVVNELVCIHLSSSDEFKPVKVIQTGKDFYSFPRLTSNTNRLTWTCWDQPEMPWDSAELWVADFHKDGRVDAVHKVAGGLSLERKESVYQPEWSNDGILHYISDSSGWGNLYSCRDGVKNALTPIDREFGIPQWSLASSTYVITKDNHIYAVYVQRGQQQLCHIDVSTGHIEPIELAIKDFGEHLLLSKNKLYYKGAGPEISEGIYEFDLLTQKNNLISLEKSFPLPASELSIAKPIEFEVDISDIDKTKNSKTRTCHAFYYEPYNTQYKAPGNTAPPLIVMSHGGPTGMTTSSLNSAIQFWTHRGFAVVDVNYSGSTGFGKKYKDRLIGNWGIVDVEDCVAVAEYLVKQNLADKDSLLIRGGSAGGYTTLCALTFYDAFKAGTSRYGISDLECLATDSHKFEARYLDVCVGEYPKEKQTYIDRSPIHFTDKLSCPILILQGEDDKVVPPNQAEMMVDALKQKGLPFAYQLYKGEAHGFRKEETIIHSLNAELSFYRQVLKIKSDEQIESVKVENL